MRPLNVNFGSLDVIDVGAHERERLLKGAGGGWKGNWYGWLVGDPTSATGGALVGNVASATVSVSGSSDGVSKNWRRLNFELSATSS
jgi:hypothetical protein